jgi:C1A family cysteine protease
MTRQRHRQSRYGWKPDLPDQRDLMFHSIMPPMMALPPKVDLRACCSPVEDQGNLGSCTAQALVGNLEFLEVKARVPYSNLSRRFLYYNERVIENSVNEDSGAMIRDGIKSLSKDGVCTERKCPYRISSFASKPSKGAYTEATDHQILEYRRLLIVKEMKTCLAEGYPFVFGFSVYESFESDEVAKTGIAPLPASGEQLLGGHAVMACGYDDSTERFIVRNSWGTKWGMKGYFTLPYGYFTDRNLSDDFWTIRRCE